MNQSRIPRDEQLRLLIDGTWRDHIRLHYPDVADPRDLITITPADIEKYFYKHPKVAQARLETWRSPIDKRPFHDVPVLWEEEGVYKVAWMDHGQPTDERFFRAPEEALAFYLASRSGI